MTVITKDITLRTKGNCDIVDITPQAVREVEESGVTNGNLTLFVSGSTAGVSTIEKESGLLADFQDMWSRVIPQNITYEHNIAWGDGNGHAHVRASVLGASMTIPFVDKRLTLGAYQQIVFVDFDNRSRKRKIVLQIMGE